MALGAPLGCTGWHWLALLFFACVLPEGCYNQFALIQKAGCVATPGRESIPRAGGSGGMLVCHGRKAATLAPTPANWFGWYIYATKVDHIKGCHLPSGKYWMSVVPYCSNPNDPDCTNYYRAYLSNDDGAMAHRFGRLEPANNSFFNSEFYGANWEPSSEQQSSSRFSVGVEGTSK